MSTRDRPASLSTKAKDSKRRLPTKLSFFDEKDPAFCRMLLVWWHIGVSIPQKLSKRDRIFH
jgi:hypothetical protein